MRHIRLLTATAILAAVSFAAMPVATAQQGGQEWFVPNQQRAAPPGGRPLPTGRPAGVPTGRPQAPPAMPFPAPDAQAEPEPPPQVQVELPPGPDVPALPKGTAPPAAVIGVLGLGEISRGSVAAQAVDKALAERMAKLQDDARKEQTAWRDVQQQIANQRGSLTPEQGRAKERELQERVTNAQRQFRDRNRVIQEAAQYARAQIERTLRQVVIRVAEVHGVNLVLHQEQVVLNYPAFDLTPEVVENLNKVLPSVILPADGVAVSDMPGAKPVGQAAARPGPVQPAASSAAAVSPATVPAAPAPTAAAPTPATPAQAPAQATPKRP